MNNTRKLLASIIADLKNSEELMIKKDRRTYSANVSFGIPGKIFLSLYTFGVIFGYRYIIEHYGDWAGLLIFIPLPFILILFQLYWRQSYEEIKPNVRQEILSLIEKNRKLMTVFETIDRPEDALDICKDLQETFIQTISSIKERRLRVFKKILQKEILFCTLILANLRSDLTSYLNRKQKILKSTKKTLEKNIGGITELEQVSEFQKARLDRQIEQFEELQRVLVKV